MPEMDVAPISAQVVLSMACVKKSDVKQKRNIQSQVDENLGARPFISRA
jgi:hypothetical protein